MVGDPVASIPDFIGADAAARRLAELPVWKSAAVIKCTPDACQQPIRLQALREGRTVYMAYPRLAVEPSFIALDPAALQARGVDLVEASTMQGAIDIGTPIPFEDMRPIDLVSVGCVAVTRLGARTGKGAGFADIELGLLRECGLVGLSTPVVTTVHPLCVVGDDEIKMTVTDSPLDWIVTEDEVIETHTPYARPAGIDWALVQPDQLDTIPVLRRLSPK